MQGYADNYRLVAKRLEEEKVLAMTETVLQAINPSIVSSLISKIKAKI